MLILYQVIYINGLIESSVQAYKLGIIKCMGSQRVGHDWASKLIELHIWVMKLRLKVTCPLSYSWQVAELGFQKSLIPEVPEPDHSTTQ